MQPCSDLIDWIQGLVLVISFRYHIVSIVSVFLALAVGVALGGGPLKGEVDNTLVEQVRPTGERKAEPGADRRAAQHQRVQRRVRRPPSRRGSSAASTAAVALVVLPGARGRGHRARRHRGHAGGTVGGTVRVGDGAARPARTSSSSTSSAASCSTAPPTWRAGGRQRLRADRRLLARAIGTDKDGGAEAVDGTSDSILAGLSTAGLLSPRGTAERRGSLVLFVGRAGAGRPSERRAPAASCPDRHLGGRRHRRRGRGRPGRLGHGGGVVGRPRRT